MLLRTDRIWSMRLPPDLKATRPLNLCTVVVYKNAMGLEIMSND